MCERIITSSLGDLLTRDCAVCKDQFQLHTEDPDEQIIVTLPCKHPFHQPCILPWLKSSGTCPVCRYALVPQPEQHTPPNTSSSSSQRNNNFGSSNISSQRSRPRSQSPFGRNMSGSDSHSGTGLFSTLFGNLSGLGSGTSPNRSSGAETHRHPRRSSSDPSSPSFSSSSSSSFPPNQQNQSSSSGSRGTRNNRSSQNGRPHVPGQWSDDMMDLD